MKRLLAVLLLPALLLSLSGCCVTDASNRLESFLWDALIGTDAATEAPPEEKHMPRVYTHKSSASAEDLPSHYEIPAIDMPGEDVQEINEEIRDTYLPLTEADPASSDAAPPCRRIDYKWAVKGDVLSLVVMGWGSSNVPGAGETGYTYCSVYNISVTRHEPLTHETVYTSSKISGVENLASCAIAGQSGSWFLKNGNTAQLFHADNRELTMQAFSDALSAARLDSAMPYIIMSTISSV